MSKDNNETETDEKERGFDLMEPTDFGGVSDKDYDDLFQDDSEDDEQSSLIDFEMEN